MASEVDAFRRQNQNRPQVVLRAVQSVDKVVTHFVEESRTSLVA